MTNVREYAQALTNAGMADDLAASVARHRMSDGSADVDRDVQAVQAGVPGEVLWEWVQAGVPLERVLAAVTAGGSVPGLVELPAGSVAPMAPWSPWAAKAGVRLLDVAAVCEVTSHDPGVVTTALGAGFTPVDLVASVHAGVDMSRMDPAQLRLLLWGPHVTSDLDVGQRVLVLAVMCARVVPLDVALVVAAGVTGEEASVVTRLVLDGRFLPDAVAAAKALCADSPVPAERTPQVRVTRGAEPAGR